MGKKTKSTEKLLTDVELELMTILWALGEGTVSDVIQRLSPKRELAYTSVSTMLRILETKQVLKTRKEGRGHVYIPQLKKSEYEAKTVKHVVERVFNGTPVALVRQLLDTVKVDENELAQIKALLDDFGSKK